MYDWGKEVLNSSPDKWADVSKNLMASASFCYWFRFRLANVENKIENLGFLLCEF